MGITRTLIAWLVVLGLQLTPHVTYAEDGGPGREVRAIRHDLPIILASRIDLKGFAIDTVIVSDNAALVQAKASNVPVMFVMVKRLGLWWLDNRIVVSGGIAIVCSTGMPGYGSSPSGVTPDVLAAANVPAPLIALAQAKLPLMLESARRIADNERAAKASQAGVGVKASYPVEGSYQSTYHVEDTYQSGELPQLCSSAEQSPFEKAGAYSIHTSMPKNTFYNFAARAPTEGESWLTRDSNGYAFFSMTVNGAATVHFNSGGSVDVWFPFVLDPKKTYSLTLGYTSPTIGPINGALNDNVLHFVLPAFSAPPATELMGEIDGDPYDR
jgi:hypothetical protein